MRPVQTVIAAFLVVTAAAGARGDEAEMGLGLGSSYVWRGITVSEDPVLQPFTEFTIGMFSVNTWGNISLDEYDRIQNHGLFSEVDLTLSCVFSVNDVDCKVGWIEYFYSGGAGDTREIYGIAKLFLFEDVFTDLGIYYDVDEKDDVYARARVGYIVRLSESLDAQITGSAAVAGDGMSVGDSGGFHDYSFSLDLVHGAESLQEIAASIVYTGSLDRDVLPEQDVDFYVACSVTIGF